jgi:preprotein translocase subunit SecY
LAGFKNVFSWQYNVLFALLIIIFSFFYTAITIPVNQMADDLKKWWFNTESKTRKRDG